MTKETQDQVAETTVDTEEKTTAVAQVETQTTAVDAPAAMDLDALATDAGCGMENAGADDKAIPFLILLQSNSPQCKKTDGKYIPGAQEGMLLNTVTSALYDKVTVIPVFWDKVALEWRPERGGLAGVHAADAPIVATANRVVTAEGKIKDLLPNGNELNMTSQHYVLVMAEGALPYPALISMTSTQLKKSRKWVGLMDGKKLQASDGRVFTPPSFAYQYELKAAAESKDTNSWWGWDVTDRGMVQDRSVYELAKAFYQSLKAGQQRATAEQYSAAMADEAPAAASTATGAPQQGTTVDGEVIPF